MVALDTFAVSALPVPVTTPEPTPAPTSEPPSEPVVPTTTTLEAEATSVAQSGAWMLTADANASGGAYQLSSGTPRIHSSSPSPAMYCAGYVQHPALGTFAVEVDGLSVQTVNTAGDVSFGARVALSGLGAGEHTVRILPTAGMVALDGFESIAP